MKFSVLIPVYNAEKYIDDCIKSIFSQTHKNFEIVLVDDGSKDNSAEICDRYQSKYPQLIKVIHQENQGQLVTRQLAVKRADGDYCIFVDSDDIIVEDALEILDNTIQKYNHPDMVMYPFYYDRNGKLDKSRVISETEKFYDKDDKSLKELFFSDILLNSMCTKCVKRSVLLSSSYDTEMFSFLRCSEDRLQSMWVLDNVSTAVYINVALYRYRLFEGSVTRQYSYDSIDRFNDVVLYDEQIQYAKKWNLYSKEWSDEFDAKAIRSLIYVFDLFYTKVPKNEKRAVLEYPWKSFLPDENMICTLNENKYINKTQKNVCCWIVNGNHFRIRMYYIKKYTYKKLKQVKSNLLSGRKNG